MNPSRKTFLKGCITGAVLTTVVPAVVGLLLLLAFKETFIRYKQKELTAPPIPFGEKADYGWSLLDKDGNKVPFSLFEGKPIFLHFWHPDCTICASEIEAVNALWEKVKTLDVAFLCVTWTEQAELNGAIAARGIRYPTYLLNGGRPAVFQNPGTPNTYIVAANGDIVFKYLGGAKWDADVVFNYLLSLTRPASGTPAQP